MALAAAVAGTAVVAGAVCAEAKVAGSISAHEIVQILFIIVSPQKRWKRGSKSPAYRFGVNDEGLISPFRINYISPACAEIDRISQVDL
jgi:hypothetical protein